MRKMSKTAEQVLIKMIVLMTEYLEDLKHVRSDDPTAEFAYGEKTAYVECLELISEWIYADRFGLDFEVEERFSL